MSWTRRFRRRLKKKLQTTKKPRKVHLEALEPRILLSSDPLSDPAAAVDLEDDDGTDPLLLIDSAGQSTLIDGALDEKSAVESLTGRAGNENEGGDDPVAWALSDTDVILISPDPGADPVDWLLRYNKKRRSIELVDQTDRDKVLWDIRAHSNAPIVLQGTGGDDRFTIDQSARAKYCGAISVDGAGGADRLTLKTNRQIHHLHFAQSGDFAGSVGLDGRAIDFIDLERVTQDGRRSHTNAHVSLEGTSGNDNWEVESEVRGRLSNQISLSSDGTDISFARPFQGLAIDTGDGRDTLALHDVSMKRGDLVIDGGRGDDTLFVDVLNGETDIDWTIDVLNAGSVAGHPFTGIENLLGGADDSDTFFFGPNAYLDGIVDGGGGADRIVIDDSENLFSDLEHASTSPQGGRISTGNRDIDHRRVESIELTSSADAQTASVENDANVRITQGEDGLLHLDISYAFDAELVVSDLSDAEGHRFDGLRTGTQLAQAVGDLTGDGIEDLVLGSPADHKVHVLFGSDQGFAGIDLDSLDGTQGFVIEGETPGDGFGAALGFADVNADGSDDLILGAPEAEGGRGRAYVLYGSPELASGGLASLEIAALESRGFVIQGLNPGDRLGASLAGLDDLNADEIGDFALGAPGASNGAGAVYTLFGPLTLAGDSTNGTNALFDLSTLDGSNGFVVSGENAGDALGASVADAGDLNADAVRDLVIGSPGADVNGIDSGQALVLYGFDGFEAAYTPSALDGVTGFRIQGIAAGDRAGTSVSGAGDLDNDGHADLLIGSPLADVTDALGTLHSDAGQVHVVYGIYALVEESGFGSELALAGLDGSQGFTIDGVAAGDHTGLVVSELADLNDDGISDLAIAAPGAGVAYVLLGDTGFGSEGRPALADLDGISGFKLEAGLATDGVGQSLGSADIDADGIDDLLLGTPGAGSFYALFGRTDGSAATRYSFDLSGAESFTLDAGDKQATVVIGQEQTPGPQKTVTSIRTGGANFITNLIDADSVWEKAATSGGSRITVAADTVLDTRARDNEGNLIAGEAGNIQLVAAEITVAEGASLLASADVDGASAGDIVLRAKDNISTSNWSYAEILEQWDETFGGRKATVEIQSGAEIRGGEIEINANAGDLDQFEAAVQALSGGNFLAPLETFVSLFSSPISFSYKKSTATIDIGESEGEAVLIEGEEDVTIEATAEAFAEANGVYYQNSKAHFGLTIVVLIADATATVDIDGGDEETRTLIRSEHGNVEITSEVENKAKGKSEIRQNMGANPYTGNEFPSNPNNIGVSIGAYFSDLKSHVTLAEFTQVEADAGDVAILAAGEDQTGGTIKSTSYQDGKSGLTLGILYATPDVKTVVQGRVISGAPAIDEPFVVFDPFGSASDGAGGFVPVVDFAADTIQMGAGTSYVTGERVTYSAGFGGGAIEGLESGQDYYVIADDGGSSLIQLAESRQAAKQGDAIDLVGTPSFTLADSGIVLPFSSVMGGIDAITWSTSPGLADGTELIYHAFEGKAVGGLVDGRSYFALNGDDPTRLQLTDESGNLVDLEVQPTFEVMAVAAGSGAQVGDILEVESFNANIGVVTFKNEHLLSAGDQLAYHGAIGVTLLGEDETPLPDGTLLYAIPTFNSNVPTGALDSRAIRLAESPEDAIDSDGYSDSINFEVSTLVMHGNVHSLERNQSLSIESKLDTEYHISQKSQIGGKPGFAARYTDPLLGALTFAYFKDPFEFFSEAGAEEAAGPFQNNEAGDLVNARTSGNVAEGAVALQTAIVQTNVQTIIGSTADLVSSGEIEIGTEQAMVRGFVVEGATAEGAKGDAQTPTTFDIAGAVSVTVFDSNVQTVVQGGAQLDAPDKIEIGADIWYPVEAPIEGSGDDWLDFVVKEAEHDPKTLIKQVVDPWFFFSDSVASGYTTTRAQLEEAEIALAVTVNFASFTNNVEAIVADGALINQRFDPPGGDDDERSVSVTADLDMLTFQISGVFDFGLGLKKIPKQVAELASRQFYPSGVNAEKAALGVTLQWYDINNTVHAAVSVPSPVDDHGHSIPEGERGEGAKIHTGEEGEGLSVRAEDKTWYFGMVATGASTTGETGALAFSGGGQVVRYNQRKGATTARIGSGAEIDGGPVEVVAIGNQVFFGANGDIVKGLNNGLGVGINYFELHRRTKAYIGEEDGQAGVDEADLRVSSIDLGPEADLNIVAVNKGWTASLALAADLRTEVPEPENAEIENQAAPDAAANNNAANGQGGQDIDNSVPNAEEAADAGAGSDVDPDGSGGGGNVIDNPLLDLAVAAGESGRSPADGSAGSPGVLAANDAHGPATGKASIAIAGDASVIKLAADEALAFIDDPGSFQAHDVKVAAENSGVHNAFAGAFSIEHQDDAQQPASNGIAGSFSSILLEAGQGDTRAYIARADLEAESVDVIANRNSTFGSFAAGGAGEVQRRSAVTYEVAGSAAYNSIHYKTQASIENGSAISVGDDSWVNAFDGVLIFAVAGDASDGGTVGVGTSWAWNQLDRQVLAGVSASSITQSEGDFDIHAKLNTRSKGGNELLPVTYAVAATRSVEASKLDLAGTVAVNQLSSRLGNHQRAVEASFTGSSYENTGDGAGEDAGLLDIHAQDLSNVLAVSGGVSLGAKTGIGLAAAVNEVDDDAAALIQDSRIATTGDVRVYSRTQPEFNAFALGINASSNFGVAGSGAANRVDLRNEAYVEDTTGDHRNRRRRDGRSHLGPEIS